MKTPLTSIGLALITWVAVAGLSGCSKSETPGNNAATATKYTCPMHPEVVQDQPGNCPKCGMKLVEKH
jgi:Cu(I)/Ag(I) efflux system membrane fusion protein